MEAAARKRQRCGGHPELRQLQARRRPRCPFEPACRGSDGGAGVGMAAVEQHAADAHGGVDMFAFTGRAQTFGMCLTVRTAGIAVMVRNCDTASIAAAEGGKVRLHHEGRLLLQLAPDANTVRIGWMSATIASVRVSVATPVAGVRERDIRTATIRRQAGGATAADDAALRWTELELSHDTTTLVDIPREAHRPTGWIVQYDRDPRRAGGTHVYLRVDDLRLVGASW